MPSLVVAMYGYDDPELNTVLRSKLENGAPGTSTALITAAACVGRATVGTSARVRLQWELTAASARFARLEVREARRRPSGGMVALTNPVWLA